MQMRISSRLCILFGFFPFALSLFLSHLNIWPMLRRNPSSAELGSTPPRRDMIKPQLHATIHVQRGIRTHQRQLSGRIEG
ncbi:hypothetical protein B0T26DRAFT_711617 [Lasiosphaeria miniovina]|uniref:Uncharacterized protein n=1 Tax=Lasiosphaeria miniovina TaxID=1954250 RepID=A0AA40DY76_9PEZI|nr:uncharacterized protein B0T26DRAFT_711617 [Lasiosphaeria miniovina]KAK0718027.1 hypothetical protein B0T26DRAFT_711617 [Lasiosphaeria miniovina]